MRFLTRHLRSVNTSLKKRKHVTYESQLYYLEKLNGFVL